VKTNYITYQFRNIIFTDRAIQPWDRMPQLHFHPSSAYGSYTPFFYDTLWTAYTRAAVLPVIVAAMSGYTWEYGLPACKEQVDR
jgi:hypothetical protein